MKTKLVSTSILALVLAGSTHGAVTVLIEEVGNDVTVSYSGSINLTGLGGKFDFSNTATTIFPGSGEVRNYSGAFDLYYVAGAASAPSFGTGNETVASTATGDNFAFYSDDLVVPDGYTSGNPISGAMTFLNTDLATLGVSVGTVTHTLNNSDTVTLTAVPEPASFAAIFGAAVMGLVCLRRRARK